MLYIDSLAQDCGNSFVLAMELQLSCVKAAINQIAGKYTVVSVMQ